MAKFRQAAAHAHGVFWQSVASRDVMHVWGANGHLRPAGAIGAAAPHAAAACCGCLACRPAHDGRRAFGSPHGPSVAALTFEEFAWRQTGDIGSPSPPLCPLHNLFSERRPAGRRRHTDISRRKGQLRFLQDGSNCLVALSLSILRLSDLSGENMIKSS